MGAVKNLFAKQKEAKIVVPTTLQKIVNTISPQNYALIIEHKIYSGMDAIDVSTNVAELRQKALVLAELYAAFCHGTFEAQPADAGGIDTCYVVTNNEGSTYCAVAVANVKAYIEQR